MRPRQGYALPMSPESPESPADVRTGRVARRVLVSGRVQGVAFRWSALEQARRLGLDGWIRNLRDGRVEAWIEAAEDSGSLERMLGWLAEGPPLARVDDCEVTEVPAVGERGFEVLVTR